MRRLKKLYQLERNTEIDISKYDFTDRDGNLIKYVMFERMDGMYAILSYNGEQFNLTGSLEVYVDC